MNQTIRIPFRRRVLASALLFAFALPAFAETDLRAIDDALRQDLLTPDSRVSVGFGNLSGEHRRYNLYRGFDDDGIYGLIDANLDFRKGDGTAIRLSGRDLGLDTRSLQVEGERQGAWRLGLGYRQMIRHEALTPVAALDGVGSASQTVNGTAVRPLELELSRDIATLGARRYFSDDYSVRIGFRQDERAGDRMYGARNGNNSMNFFAEPIDRTIQSWEIVAAKGGKGLQWTAGYAGSSFRNKVPALSITGGGSFPVIALAPDNDAHQLNASIGYDFTASTRATAKASYEVATQNDSFVVPGVQPSLNGEIVTTRLFADLTTRPTEDLDLVANLRYDDRDDRTPLVNYLPTTAASGAPTPSPNLFTAGITGFNVPRDIETLNSTVEATYRIANDLRLSGGLEREDITRKVPDTYRRVAYRRHTDETTARAGLTRMLSETLNGSVAYLYSQRRGSEYIPDTYAASSNQVHPMIWADRTRDKLRLTADWIPGEDWSVQGIADLSQDRYSGRNLGPRKGDGHFLSVDANYVISFRWTLSAWASQESNQADQSTRTQLNGTTGAENVIWDASLQQTTTAWGITLRGKPMSQLQVTAELSRSTDKAEHDMAQTGGTGTIGPTSLPDYEYRTTTLKLSGDYSLDRNSGVQVEVIADQRENNDWTWLGWTYDDGTTVINPSDETAVFAGVRYRYRWR